MKVGNFQSKYFSTELSKEEQKQARQGAEFVYAKNKDLVKSFEVKAVSPGRDSNYENAQNNPIAKIADWVQILERIHYKNKNKPQIIERLKNYYYKKNIIRFDDIPEVYYENQKKLLRERGWGDIELNENQKRELSETVIADQKSTLNLWFDYFMSDDSNSFPMWAKYWAFNGMLKLSGYDKEKHEFGRRTKGTVAPFPDLDREALAYVIDTVIKYSQDKGKMLDIADDEYKKLLKSGSFGKLYAYAIEKVTPTEENELTNIAGEWKKYPQNSNHLSLVKSLQGYGTGWCTAGEATAQTQLAGGDFYVYYSYKNGKAVVPRAAIRMEETGIAEVRGIAAGQNLDSYISSVVEEKLKEFPDGEKYKKKVRYMEDLTNLDKKVKNNIDLSLDELRFLYEIDEKIEGFGYQKDPRIMEIQSNRNIRSDLSNIFNCLENEISLTKEEALHGGIKYHYGDLDLSDLTSAEGLVLPEKIGGCLDLEKLLSAEGLVLPKEVSGALYLGGLLNAEGLVLPEKIGDSLDLNGLTSSKGVVLLKEIGGSLLLNGLTSVEGLVLPKNIGGSLWLTHLKRADGFDLSNCDIKYYLFLSSSLPSTEKDKLLKKYPYLQKNILVVV